jgi:hypothetical protein
VLQALLGGRGLDDLAYCATILLLYAVTASWWLSAGQLPSDIHAGWWGACVLLVSVPVLVSVWVTHLGLWDVVDPVAELIFHVVALFLLTALPVLVVAGVVFGLFKLRAVFARTVAAVWTAAKHMGSYTGQVLTLPRPGDLGLYAVMAVMGCMCGTSLGEQLPPQVLEMLHGTLRFWAGPVTAPLWLLAACLEASTGVLWRVLVPTAGGLLSLLRPAARWYVTHYLLPQQIVLSLKTWACTIDANLVATADSNIRRQIPAGVEAVCGDLQAIAGAKADFRVRPQRLWWLDLLLLAWFGFVCWRIWLGFKSSRSVPAAVRAVELERRQRLEAARQRKEAKAAERKRQKQLERVCG